MYTKFGASMKKQSFGQTADGEPIDVYKLTNRNGIEMQVLSYGGIVMSLKTPDRTGKLSDIVLGFDHIDDYLNHNPYFGALIGRYGNRIADGKFSLQGHDFQLTRNNGDNHLHGGWRGFDKVIWTVQQTGSLTGVSLAMSYISKDGEEGYPGNLMINVVYTLTDEDEWQIDYRAATDTETIINLTQHSYFNLAGAGNVLDHELLINAEQFTPVGEGLIPTGELREVKGTSMDFTHPTTIGAQINKPDEQLRIAGGYDHNWVLRKSRDGKRLAATVFEPQSGRELEIYTTEPGLQFYSGNFLDGSLIGKGGKRYDKHAGFCLETQHFPDSPNHANFPATTLQPGEIYRTTTVYKFLVQ